MKPAYSYGFTDEPQFRTACDRAWLANYLRSCRKQSHLRLTRLQAGCYHVSRVGSTATAEIRQEPTLAPDWRAQLCNNARTQYRGLFRTMAADGGRFHLYRYPTAVAPFSAVVLLRQDAQPPRGATVVVTDVQACDEQALSARLSWALP